MGHPLSEELRKLTEQGKWLGRPVAELLAALRRAAGALDDAIDWWEKSVSTGESLVIERDELQARNRLATRRAERAEAQAARYREALEGLRDNYDTEYGVDCGIVEHAIAVLREPETCNRCGLMVNAPDCDCPSEEKTDE